MEIENAVSVYKANEDEVLIRVRSVGEDDVKYENLEVQEGEDEGKYYIGLATEHIGIQIKIEDVPVVMDAIRQAYEKQVVNEHKRKWSN